MTARDRLDGLQQRHGLLGFPLAVVRKSGEDNVGNLASLLAWNAFVSIFPLLLVLVTLLGVALRSDPTLQHQVLHSALADFPVIGAQLQQNVHSLNRTGLGLAVGLGGTLFGARGVADAAQNALNAIWEIPYVRRPGFVPALLRDLALVCSFGVGILVTTSLSGYGAGVHGPLAARLGAVAVSFLLNVCLFWTAFRLATAAEVKPHDLWLSALLTAIGWQLLQLAGGYLVATELRHANQVYGVFAIVLGLASWLYLLAEIALYAVEIDVVRARRLWPRSLFAGTLTDADVRAFGTYAAMQARRTDQSIRVTYREAPS